MRNLIIIFSIYAVLISNNALGGPWQITIDCGSESFESCASEAPITNILEPVWHWKDREIIFSNDGSNSFSWVGNDGSGTDHLELIRGEHYIKDSCWGPNCTWRDGVSSDIRARIVDSEGNQQAFMRIFKLHSIYGVNFETICIGSKLSYLNMHEMMCEPHRCPKACSAKRF